MDVGGTSHRPRIPGYEILRRIDRGDGADCYLALDSRGHHVECVIGSGTAEMSVPAPRLLPALTHPHLVHIVDIVNPAECDDSNDSSVVVIEYLQGGTLAALLNASGALDIGQVVTVMEPIARAVAHVHGFGIAVGGVGAGSVYLAASGMPKLLPPRAIRALGRTALTATGDAEHGVTLEPSASGPSGPGAGQRADVRDLGTLAWTLLTGRPPPSGTMRPPIRVYHPDLPDGLADAIEAPDTLTAAEFADVVGSVGASYVDAAAAPLRLTRTDAYEPSSDALTAQLRLSARAGNGGGADDVRGTSAGRPSWPVARRRTVRARHRRRRPARRRLWLAGGAVVVAAGIAAVAFGPPGGDWRGARVTESHAGETPVSEAGPAASSPPTLRPLPPSITKAAASRDPVRAVTALVRIRADMFASAERGRLRFLDVPGSTAWKEDAAKLRALRRNESRLADLEMTVVSAGQLARHAGTAVVAVTVDMSGFRQVDAAGTTLGRRDATRRESRLQLRWSNGRWLIASVD